MSAQSKKECQKIKEERETIKVLKKDFDLAVAKAGQNRDNPLEFQKIAKKAEKLKAELGKRIGALREKLPIKEIKAIWENPENKERKEIIINLNEEIKYFKEFYLKNLEIELGPEKEREIRQIWNKNRKEIQKEMETYGYDTILIIPDNLPDLKTLNKDLIETMEEPGKGRVVSTYQSDNFKESGGFEGVRNTEKPGLRIVLTKNIQNTNQSGDPIIEATLNKDIMGLTGLTQKEAEERIKNQEPLPISFKTRIQNKEITIQAEGLSFEEYIIFQRTYFDRYQKHLDEIGWTWLLKSLSGARVVASYWAPVVRRLSAYALDPDLSYDALGGRPSRSFCF